MLNPTRKDELVDAAGRPYFLWDSEMTSTEFKAALHHADPAIRGYFLAKLMRQAKPDDVFLYASLETIRVNWKHIEAHLGDKGPFWRWLLDSWRINRAK